MFEYMPTPEEMVDSIEAKFGIKITPPLGYVLTTGEWLSLSSQRGGINHISPVNGVIEGKNFIALIRFGNTIMEKSERYSTYHDAYFVNEFHISSPTLRPPKDFEPSPYISKVDSIMSSKLGMDSVMYLDVPKEYNVIGYARNMDEESRINKLWTEKYTNCRCYYLNKKGYPTFRIIILWKNIRHNQDKKILRFIDKLAN